MADADAAATGDQPHPQGDSGQSSGADRGFPANTPVAEMTDAQRAAYFRYQNRQADNKLAAFKGVTPQQVQAMQQELEALRNEKLSADQKAVKEAEKAARAAADAEWRPKYQRSELRGIASQVLKGDQLKAWLDGMNPAAFTDENGEIDEEKVMGHLTAAFGAGGQQGQQQATGQRQPSWGQHSGGAGGGPLRPGEAGRAEAAKRFGAKST
ncbi:hypothetical protein [Mycobacterium canetti]|uniref:hypothetical protein n=1 Tax=Mycobacterium canetti TaxID=78331 RepID=UPI0005C7760C|nr:hypothetical protein [Mycobacterium canetti]